MVKSIKYNKQNNWNYSVVLWCVKLAFLMCKGVNISLFITSHYTRKHTHTPQHITPPYCDPFDMWYAIMKSSETTHKLTCDPYNKPHIFEWIWGELKIIFSPFYLHLLSILSSFIFYFIFIYFPFYLHLFSILSSFFLHLFSIFSSFFHHFFFFLIYLSSLYFLILNYLFRKNNSIHSFIPFYFSSFF